ncbi:hypothetical protein A6U87_10545 [Rhizobium sp. AC44/96]|nr:hypothetical protein A6U87_10545 [Rhizobium sp. AC44/96]
MGGNPVKARNATIVQWLVRMTCVIALLFVGFAHKAPGFGATTFAAAEFAEYVLPDGTLPILCLAEKAVDTQTHHKMHAPGCEACRIGASVLLPTPADIGNERLRLEGVVQAPYAAAAFERRLFAPSKGPRAPPHDSASA